MPFLNNAPILNSLKTFTFSGRQKERQHWSKMRLLSVKLMFQLHSYLNLK